MLEGRRGKGGLEGVVLGYPEQQGRIFPFKGISQLPWSRYPTWAHINLKITWQPKLKNS